MQIQHNFSLKNYNTFGIEAKAKQFVAVHNLDELQAVLKNHSSEKKFILGGGSNMLLTQDIDALVIHIDLKGKKIIKEDDDFVWVESQAGEVWHEFVLWTIDQNFGGLENMSLIPGNVGTTPVQNIGAYGVEIKDVFESCETFNIASKTFKTFYKKDCKFDYRESVFKQELKNKYIITSVRFKLSNIPHLNISYGAISQELAQQEIKNPSIKDISKVVSAIRVSKLPDPSTIGNAGSFFKNPIISLSEFESIHQKFPDIVHFIVQGGIKLAAGWLIEQCGWKGKVVGNTGTWKNQALVLVNHGSATGKEVFEFSEQIIQSVKKTYNVVLEREVNIF